MTAPADIEPTLAAVLERVSAELTAVAETLAKIETLVALIASAATAK